MRFLTLSALILSLPVAAIAHDDAITHAVKARQGYFAMLGSNIGTLAGMARGKVDYDAEAAATAAANIEALSGYTIGMHFPEGSSADDLGADTTEASAAIWTDMAKFEELYGDLQEAAAGASEKVAGGADSLGPVVGAIGGACKACHDSFRVK